MEATAFLSKHIGESTICKIPLRKTPHRDKYHTNYARRYLKMNIKLYYEILVEIEASHYLTSHKQKT